MKKSMNKIFYIIILSLLIFFSLASAQYPTQATPGSLVPVPQDSQQPSSSPEVITGPLVPVPQDSQQPITTGSLVPIGSQSIKVSPQIPIISSNTGINAYFGFGTPKGTQNLGEKCSKNNEIVGYRTGRVGISYPIYAEKNYGYCKPCFQCENTGGYKLTLGTQYFGFKSPAVEQKCMYTPNGLGCNSDNGIGVCNMGNCISKCKTSQDCPFYNTPTKGRFCERILYKGEVLDAVYLGGYKNACVKGKCVNEKAKDNKNNIVFCKKSEYCIYLPTYYDNKDLLNSKGVVANCIQKPPPKI